MNFTATPPDDNSNTIDPHLQSASEALRSLNTLRNKGTLTPRAALAAFEQLAANIRRDFPEVTQQSAAGVEEMSTADLLASYWQRIEDRKQAVGVGLRGLNAALNGGLQPKRLLVLLGPPGGGKTSFANQIATHVAAAHPVMYATSEDAPDVLIAKTIARIGKLPYSAARHGWKDYRQAIDTARAELNAHPAAQNLRYLDMTGGGLSLATLRERAQAHFAGKDGPGLLVVDYLQRMARAIRDAAGLRELREAVTFLTEELRALACDLECCVLAVASMHRASGYGRVADTNALGAAKESGDVEYTADVIMALVGVVEDSNKKVDPVLRIDKNRLGAVTSIPLVWRGDWQCFTEKGEA
jgi:replicative DNA helicase